MGVTRLKIDQDIYVWCANFPTPAPLVARLFHSLQEQTVFFYSESHGRDKIF